MNALKTLDRNLVARTQPPAKLNLFLEVLGRRTDGYHEIDTVMVPINWCDSLTVRRREQPGVSLHVAWMPSLAAVAAELGVAPDSDAGRRLLSIPEDETNLVHSALTRFADRFGVPGGFECWLTKSIPAGAGLGGASSDAAAALLSAAALCGLDAAAPALPGIAADIGSDVPFFLGDRQQPPGACAALRARGRGERLAAVPVAHPIDFVVAYPAVSLSTAKVYAECQVPPQPRSPDALIGALATADYDGICSGLGNRLTAAAKKNALQIDEILKSMWHVGLRTCQLTGSGSACFAVVRTAAEAEACSARLQQHIAGRAARDKASQRAAGTESRLQRSKDRLGARIRAARSVRVPPHVALFHQEPPPQS